MSRPASPSAPGVVAGVASVVAVLCGRVALCVTWTVVAVRRARGGQDHRPEQQRGGSAAWVSLCGRDVANNWLHDGSYDLTEAGLIPVRACRTFDAI